MINCVHDALNLTPKIPTHLRHHHCICYYRLYYHFLLSTSFFTLKIVFTANNAIYRRIESIMARYSARRDSYTVSYYTLLQQT